MSFTSSLGTGQSEPASIALGWPSAYVCSATSSLSLSHNTVGDPDFHTVFDVVIPLTGLHKDSQGTHALILALLQYAARHSERRKNQDLNPVVEVLTQFEIAGVNQNALKYLRTFLNGALEASSRRPF